MRRSKPNDADGRAVEIGRARREDLTPGLTSAGLPAVASGSGSRDRRWCRPIRGGDAQERFNVVGAEQHAAGRHFAHELDPGEAECRRNATVTW